MKNNVKVIIGYVIAIAVIFGIIALIYRGTSGADETLTYDKVVSYFQNEEVRKFEVSNKNVLTISIIQRDGEGNVVKDDKGEERLFKKSYQLASLTIFHEDLDELILDQIDRGIITEAEYQPATSMPWWLYYVPWILISVVGVLGRY